MADPADFKITATPHLRVRNAASAIEFYKRAFGAVEVERLTTPDGLIPHAQMKIGDAPFSLGEESPADGSPSPQTLGGSAVGIDLIVPNVDELAAQAVAAGAVIVYEIKDQFYGLRKGRLLDPFGHIWMIGTPIEAMSPEETQRRFDTMFKGS